MKYDVVIAGAGVSGVPAAVAAAREGAKTLLLEQTARPGGTMETGLGFPICGLFENSVSLSPKLLNKGLAAELYSLISARVPNPAERMGRVTVCRCPVPLFQTVYSRWIETENLTAVFGVRNLMVTVQDNCIEQIRFRAQDGVEHKCCSGQVVDCTGSGAVVQLCGAEIIDPKRLPLAGFSVRLAECEPDDMLPIQVPYVLRKAVKSKEIPPCCAFTVLSVEPPNGALCKFSLPPETTREEAGQIVHQALTILQQRVSALRAAKPVEFSPGVLSREGIRLKGKRVLTEENVQTGQRFNDGIAHAAWPMECATGRSVCLSEGWRPL